MVRGRGGMGAVLEMNPVPSRRKAKRGLFFLVAKIVFNLSLILLISYFGWRGYLALSSSSRFAFTRLEVRGINHTSFSEVKRLLSFAYGESLLRLDLFRVRRVLLTSPWIEDVVVSRMLPDGLRVDIKEAKPIALVEMDGRRLLATSKGMTLPLASFLAQGGYTGSVSSRRERVKSLPRLAVDHLPPPGELISIVSLLSAARRVARVHGEMIVSARLTREKGLIVRLSSLPADVILGSGEGVRLERLFGIYPELLRFRARVEYIDLRFSGEIVIKRKGSEESS